jgi:hypothetical protein
MSDIMNSADVRVAHPPRQTHLVVEPLHAVRSLRERSWQELQSNRLIESQVLCTIDFPHPPLSQEPYNPVPAGEECPRGELSSTGLARRQRPCVPSRMRTPAVCRPPCATRTRRKGCGRLARGTDALRRSVTRSCNGVGDLCVRHTPERRTTAAAETLARGGRLPARCTGDRFRHRFVPVARDPVVFRIRQRSAYTRS